MSVYTYDLLFIYGIRFSITLVFELELTACWTKYKAWSDSWALKNK